MFILGETFFPCTHTHSAVLPINRFLRRLVKCLVSCALFGVKVVLSGRLSWHRNKPLVPTEESG